MTDQIVEKHVNDWKDELKDLFYDERMDQTFASIKNYTPEAKWIFRAFRECSFNDIKLVLVGQDPYPKAGVADGLAFSCSRKNIEEKSLRVIKDAMFREGIHDFEPRDWEVTDLSYLANQGVLMLNCALTCQVDTPGSHYEEWGWFIEEVLTKLQDKNLTYLLYGKKAQTLKEHIKGTIFEGYHPAAEIRSGGQYKFKTFFQETKLKLDWLPMKKNNLPQGFEEVQGKIGEYPKIDDV